MKVVITRTRENFLLPHADLQNLDLLFTDFPEYLGERRRTYIKSVQEENKLTSRQCDPENEYPTVIREEAKIITDDGDDILANQCESAVTMEFSEELSNEQVTEAEGTPCYTHWADRHKVMSHKRHWTNNAIQRRRKRLILTMIQDCYYDNMYLMCQAIIVTQ